MDIYLPKDLINIVENYSRSCFDEVMHELQASIDFALFRTCSFDIEIIEVSPRCYKLDEVASSDIQRWYRFWLSLLRRIKRMKIDKYFYDV